MFLQGENFVQDVRSSLSVAHDFGARETFLVLVNSLLKRLQSLSGKELIELDVLHVKQSSEDQKLMLAVLDKNTRVVAQCLFDLENENCFNEIEIPKCLQQYEIVKNGILIEVCLFVKSLKQHQVLYH